MGRLKARSLAAQIEKMMDEASWLLSHAQALADYGREDEAAGEWARAAACEEQLACLLEADDQELEAALHRVSAAACHQKLAQPVRAATLLRAALSAELPVDFQARVEKQLAAALDQARKQLHKASRKPRGAIATQSERVMREK